MPSGVTWPTVSHTIRRCAPCSTAFVNSLVSTSGRERVVSSVTYATGRLYLRPRSIASADSFIMRARSQSSAYWRIGELPMKHSTSISMPTFCEMSMIAWTSLTCVRAAHDALTRSLPSLDVLGDRRDVLDRALAGARQADVHRVDAEVVREVDEPQLVVDRRVDHRRRLDAVAQRLVEELDRAASATAARPSRSSSSRRSARGRSHRIDVLTSRRGGSAITTTVAPTTIASIRNQPSTSAAAGEPEAERATAGTRARGARATRSTRRPRSREPGHAEPRRSGVAHTRSLRRPRRRRTRATPSTSAAIAAARRSSQRAAARSARRAGARASRLRL